MRALEQKSKQLLALTFSYRAGLLHQFNFSSQVWVFYVELARGWAVEHKFIVLTDHVHFFTIRHLRQLRLWGFDSQQVHILIV